MRPEIAVRKDEITVICRRHGVARLEIFGSAARGDDFDPDNSDADFLVEDGVITNSYLLVAINTYKERVYAA